MFPENFCDKIQLLDIFCRVFFSNHLLIFLWSNPLVNKFDINWNIINWFGLLNINLDMLKMLPNFYFDEITLLDIYLEFILWANILPCKWNSFAFDNFVTFEHACKPSLIWDMLYIYIYTLSRYAFLSPYHYLLVCLIVMINLSYFVWILHCCILT